MPYVDIHSTDDYASLYYSTNSPGGNVSGFDPAKPTIIMLPPLFLDSTWLDNQFGDPRLNESFNLIAFDMRVSGRSTCRPNERHDSWVEAADLAHFHQVRCINHTRKLVVGNFWYFRHYIFLLAIFSLLKPCPSIALSALQFCTYSTPLAPSFLG
jgi:pimeloyl-ACP methyl ester carboxylesterase